MASQSFPYLPPSKAITLTWDTATAELLNEASSVVVSSRIMQISTSAAGGADLQIIGPGGAMSPGIIWTTTSTPAAVAALTGQHILLTPSDTTKPAYYVHVGLITALNDQSTYRVVSVNGGGVTAFVNVSDTLAALTSAINAAIVSDSPVSATFALAGTNQGNAVAITTTEGVQNFITLTGADSVKGGRLPATTATAIGTVVTLFNSAASPNVAFVYPASGEQIANGGANIPIQIPAGESVQLTLMSADNWKYTNFRVARAITAAGNATGNAAVFILTDGQSNLALASGFDGTTGIRPTVPTIAGTTFTVTAQGTAAGFVYPPTGHNFGLGANIPLRVPIGTSLTATFISGTTWVADNQVNVQFITATGVNSGNAAVFTPVDGVHNLIIVSTPSAAEGVRFGAVTSSSTTVQIYNPSGAFNTNVYPVTGGNFGNGVNAAMVLNAAGVANYASTGTSYDCGGVFIAVTSNFIFSNTTELGLGVGSTVKVNITEDFTDQLQAHNLFVQVIESATAVATPITGDIVRVDLSGAATDSVILSGLSDHLFVKHAGAGGTPGFILKPPASGTLNGQAAGTGIFMHPGAIVELAATDTANPHQTYEAVYLNPGISPQTASTTQTQAGGLPVTGDINITTAAVAGDALTIVKGVKRASVTNSAAANAIQVFPPLGGTINGGAANASKTVYANSDVEFVSQNGLDFKMTGVRKGTSVFNGAGGLFTVADTNIAATSVVSVSTTSIAATTAVGYSTAITPTTGFTTTNFDAAGAVVADTRTTMYTITY